MFLLVLAHPGCPGQNPQSRKTVVCVRVLPKVSVVHVLCVMSRFIKCVALSSVKTMDVPYLQNSFFGLLLNLQNIVMLVIIVSASLSINIVELVAYTICWSECYCMCPESVLWQNGWYKG